MNNGNKIKLFLVDDDALFLKTLEIEFLQLTNFELKTFATGELCVAQLESRPDIIILDYYLDAVDPAAMDGIATLDRIKAHDPSIHVVMLSAQDKIEVAINCMHHHATDYVVKSETAFLRLQKIIMSILEFKRMEKVVNWYVERNG